MGPIKSAVIGVGYLGKFHAQKYAELPQSELIAVCDNNIEAASTVAGDLNTRAVNKLDELLPDVDAVSIVVPTQLHYEIAKQYREKALKGGK